MESCACSGGFHVVQSRSIPSVCLQNISIFGGALYIIAANSKKAVGAKKSN